MKRVAFYFLCIIGIAPTLSMAEKCSVKIYPSTRWFGINAVNVATNKVADETVHNESAARIASRIGQSVETVKAEADKPLTSVRRVFEYAKCGEVLLPPTYDRNHVIKEPF